MSKHDRIRKVNSKTKNLTISIFQSSWMKTGWDGVLKKWIKNENLFVMYCFQFTHVQFVSRHFSFVLLESCFRNVEEKKFILVHIRTICIIVQSLCLLKLFISCICGFVSLSSKSNILHGISSILYFNLYGKLCKVNYLPFIRN